jgi:hypothetical protein
MSLIDKALGAVTPPESEDARAEATRVARSASDGHDWLALALDHHDQIRAAFDDCRQAAGGAARLKAMQALAYILNGHAYAEEVVLYPAMAKFGEKGHAGMAYTEQSTAKMQMAELERIDPTTESWGDKLEHICGGILHHIYEEEKVWFPELKRDHDDQNLLTLRFREEFGRLDNGVKRDGEPRSFQDADVYQKPYG